MSNVFALDTFARITSNHAYLYMSAKNTIENNVLCFLEDTYFVEITLNYNEEFYKVIYNGISGYAKKNDVILVSGTPKNPYPSCKIKTINNKCYLRRTPKVNDENIVTVIPENCQDLNYIGKVYGEEAIDYQGGLWYLVSYFGVQGYIYSKYIASISSIAINSENINELESISTLNPTPLSNIECAIIVVILTIPILFIVIMMYRKPAKPKPHFARKLPKPKTKDLDELL